MGQLPGLRVVRSPIHGYGVVATRRFAAGEVVCHGDGVLWRADDDFDDTYSLILSTADVPPGVAAPAGEPEDLFWDLADQTRWINHACVPNTEIEARFHPATDAVEAWWVALRDIEIGEELTYDYGFAASVAEPCGCGSPACRGLIIAPDQIPFVEPDLARHLRPSTASPAR